MGWASFELGGMVRVLGVLSILGGVVLAIYEFSMGNRVTALVAFVALLVIGLATFSWGGYSRKQNTPIGRMDDIHRG
jgi:uncharacterized membrane protein YqjE